MIRILIWGLTAIGVIAVGAFIWRDSLMIAAMQMKLAPKVDFALSSMPAAPDYSKTSAWAAQPDFANPSDFVPTALAARDAPKEAAVFFVHGTTFVSNAGWNADLDDPEASQRRDNLVLRGQASAFNLCCNVYVPKYRQATFWSFMALSPSATAAQDLAYKDVAAAFSAFRDTIGEKPFILAGHSQGSHHLLRLIEDHASTGAMTALVAAYLPGIGIDPIDASAQIPDVPLCARPDQIGCYVSWNAMSARAVSRHTSTGNACINPLTWDAKAVAADRTANFGALSVRDEPVLTSGFVAAQCASDRLLVGIFADDMFDASLGSLGEGNFHLLDYALFYANVRQNAQTRATAAQRAMGEATSASKM